jgi:hypothetical protein
MRTQWVVGGGGRSRGEDANRELTVASNVCEAAADILGAYQKLEGVRPWLKRLLTRRFALR